MLIVILCKDGQVSMSHQISLLPFKHKKVLFAYEDSLFSEKKKKKTLLRPVELKWGEHALAREYVGVSKLMSDAALPPG